MFYEKKGEQKNKRSNKGERLRNPTRVEGDPRTTAVYQCQKPVQMGTGSNNMQQE